MWNQTYRSMNEKLTPSLQLAEDTVQRMRCRRASGKGHAKRTESPVRPIRARRLAAVCTCCVLAAALSLTAVAAAVPSFREMLFGKGQGNSTPSTPLAQTGEKLTEIENVSAEQDGFRLEILGATHDEESMMVYYTLTDVSGQDRLDKNAEIYSLASQFDVLQRNAAEKGSGEHSYYANDILAYDPETGALLCRYVLDTQNAKSIDLSRTEFSIMMIVLGAEKIHYRPLSLDESLFTTETVKLNGETVLKPGDSLLTIDGTDTQISAMGFIDGKLHVQFSYSGKENLSMNLHPIDKVISPEEVEAEGGYTAEFERREAEAYYERQGSVEEYDGEMKVHTIRGNQYFFNLEDGVPTGVSDDGFMNRSYDYEECVYELSPEDMSYYNFYYSQRSNEQELSYFNRNEQDEVSSEFQVSFDVGAASETAGKTAENLSLKEGTLSSVTLGGMGVTLTGERPLAEKAVITAQYDGETVTFSKTITTGIPASDSIMTVDSYTGPVTVRYAADRPIDPTKVTAFTINGAEVPLS